MKGKWSRGNGPSPDTGACSLVPGLGTIDLCLCSAPPSSSSLVWTHKSASARPEVQWSLTGWVIIAATRVQESREESVSDARSTFPFRITVRVMVGSPSAATMVEDICSACGGVVKVPGRSVCIVGWRGCKLAWIFKLGAPARPARTCYHALSWRGPPGVDDGRCKLARMWWRVRAGAPGHHLVGRAADLEFPHPSLRSQRTARPYSLPPADETQVRNAIACIASVYRRVARAR